MTSEILRNEECNPNLLKKKGLELLDAGKTNEAVECFSKGLVYAPFDSLMRFWRGRKLIGREEYTQSASDLKLAALENPEDWECWYYLGVACYLGGMYEEAKVAHANSKTLMKKYGVNALPATTDWYWMICMKLGQPEEAAKALEDITPDMPTEDGDYLCRVLLYKGVLKPENFVEECEKNCKNPERPRIYHLMLTYGLANYLHQPAEGAAAQARADVPVCGARHERHSVHFRPRGRDVSGSLGGRGRHGRGVRPSAAPVYADTDVCCAVD